MFKQRVVFVHGAGSFGAAAWPKQHGMALDYDALFLRRHGFDAVAEPLESDFAADAAIVLASLWRTTAAAQAGGHVVAHSQGAIAAMMAAVERPGPGAVADPGGTGLPVADRGAAGHRGAPRPDAAALRRPAPARRRRLPARVRPPRVRRGRPRRPRRRRPSGRRAGSACRRRRGRPRCRSCRACRPWS